ncbi:MAG: phosphatase [Chlorobi bacterium]|nr:phosphatase [Chlorobiota bacterium]
MADVEKLFTSIGGTFINQFTDLKSKAGKIKAFVFDWDGVFNNGSKVSDKGSPFAEPDAMGMNMLKLDFWLRNGNLPYTFIITGENNQPALALAEREHMDAAFLSYINKSEALEIICEKYGLSEDEIAFVFDDILDIEVAKKAGLSILVNRSGSPLTTDYLVSEKICDYITGNAGGNFAVREACELLIGLAGDMKKTIDTRIRFKGDYENYLLERNLKATHIYNYRRNIS